MNYNIKAFFRIGLFAIGMIGIASLIGCSSKKSVNISESDSENYAEMNQIIDVTTSEDHEAFYVRIKGNREFDYTTIQQVTPKGVIVSLRDTDIAMSKSQFMLNKDLISSINIQPMENNEAQVQILMSKDIPYDVKPEGTDLIVLFSKFHDPLAENLSIPTDTAYQDLSSAPYPLADNAFDRQQATRIHSVIATKLDDGLKVSVGADGAITNYKAFTIESPPRIVFDIFNVSSPYKNEKRVPVDTKWVKQIRYYDYTDRLRVVLDTTKANLTSYTAYPSENGLTILLGKNITPPSIPATLTNLQPVSALSKMDRIYPNATMLHSVYATQIANGVMVSLRGNGAIYDYKTSIQNEPPSIVLDLFQVTYPYQKEESFPVDTQWVKQIRQFQYPDKIRIFIDTQRGFLSSFSAQPDQNGLTVRIGSGIQAPPVEQIPTFTTPSKPAVAMTRKNAIKLRPGEIIWVNRIEFKDEPAGKSTLEIGTSHPVNYEIKETAEKKLQLVIPDTKIPDYRTRPLITTRFESAVDRIYPRQDKGKKTVFDIELREAVPYYVEQTDDALIVHFEASSISPKPMEPTPTAPQFDVAAQPPPVEEPKITAQPDLSFPAPQTPTDTVFRSAPTPAPVETQTTPLATVSALDVSTKPSIESIVSSSSISKYTGEKIALDFYDTDIKNVFRILREVSGMNFAIDKDVAGKVTLSLEHSVPWDQVMDLILKMNKLGKTMEGNIIRISTLATIEEEDKKRREIEITARTLEEQQKALDPLKTEYIAVNYSKAGAEILPHLQKLVTKDRGSVSVDDRTNMVIITDTDEKIKHAKEIVDRLDRVTPQVIIEAKVVEASANFSREIGVNWGASGGIQNDEENAGIGPQRSFDSVGGTYGYTLAMNAPATGYGTLGFNFLRIAGTPLVLSAKLMAMESQGQGRIVSAPRIVTLDNKQATIKQGLRYPYNKLDDSGNTTTTFESIDLTLDVLPHVTPDNRISLVIKIQKNDLGSIINNQQSFTTKEANTELLVNDGDTVVIGGIIKTSERDGQSRLPGIHRIPLLGWLFKNKTGSNDKEELLIFITPRIVQLEQRVTANQ